MDWFVAVPLLVVVGVATWTGHGVRARAGVAISAMLMAGALAVRPRWLLQWVVVALLARMVLLLIFGSAVLKNSNGLVGVFGLAAGLLLFYAGGAYLDGCALAPGAGDRRRAGVPVRRPASEQVLANLLWDDAIIGVLPWFSRAQYVSASSRTGSRRGPARSCWMRSGSTTPAPRRSASGRGWRARSTT